MQRNMNDWERAVSVAAAALLGIAALRLARKRRSGLALAAAGLAVRGATGYCPVNAAIGRGRRRDDTREALGGRRGVLLRESTIVHAPADELYDYWSDPANLPRVMPFLDRVDPLDERRSHWVVTGPAGTRLEWDAEIINAVPGETIGWRSLPGADVASAGSVRFTPVPGGGTEVVVTMQYDPPAGKLGATVAQWLGPSAAELVRQALGQFRTAMESSRTSTSACTQS
jgi:uncharacterized membrane protein